MFILINYSKIIINNLLSMLLIIHILELVVIIGRLE